MDIKSKRLLRNLTQDELGEQLGVSRTTVAMWETGKTRPRADTLLALSALFNCSIDELLENEIGG